MNDLKALHRAILLDPSDDLARLAYADALEETGKEPHVAARIREGMLKPHERFTGGEYWAVQQKPDKWPRGFDSPDGYEPRRIEVQLTFNRGMAYGWTCSLRDFLDAASIIFSLHPITQVRLTDKNPHLVPDEWGMGQGKYFWAHVSGGSLPDARDHWIPGELLDSPVWQLAPLGIRGLIDPACYPMYHSCEDAEHAISDALVLHGRSLVKLPLLPQHAIYGREVKTDMLDRLPRPSPA
jgi:uncharacterized protein (TIGR02996 family)